MFTVFDQFGVVEKRLAMNATITGIHLTDSEVIVSLSPHVLYYLHRSSLEPILKVDSRRKLLSTSGIASSKVIISGSLTWVLSESGSLIVLSDNETRVLASFLVVKDISLFASYGNVVAVGHLHNGIWGAVLVWANGSSVELGSR